MNNRTALILGGNGIIGREMVNQLLALNYEVYEISKPEDTSTIKIEKTVHIKCDRRCISSFKVAIDKVGHVFFDVVIDLIPFGKVDCEILHSILKGRIGHLVVLSTTLVYGINKHNNIKGEIKIGTPELAKKGFFGGYVDGKLSVEEYWTQSSFERWTIIRPYHILGGGSSIGCCPVHNRDSELLDLLLNSRELLLVAGGEFQISYIDVSDLCSMIKNIISKKSCFQKSFNAVHPKPVLVADYYRYLAELLGVKLKVKSISIDYVKQINYGWELTAFRHVYSGEKLYFESNFTPRISIKESLKNTLDNYPNSDIQAREVAKRMNIPPCQKFI